MIGKHFRGKQGTTLSGRSFKKCAVLQLIIRHSFTILVILLSEMEWKKVNACLLFLLASWIILTAKTYKYRDCPGKFRGTRPEYLLMKKLIQVTVFQNSEKNFAVLILLSKIPFWPTFLSPILFYPYSSPLH